MIIMVLNGCMLCLVACVLMSCCCVDGSASVMEVELLSAECVELQLDVKTRVITEDEIDAVVAKLRGPTCEVRRIVYVQTQRFVVWCSLGKSAEVSKVLVDIAVQPLARWDVTVIVHPGEVVSPDLQCEEDREGVEIDDILPQEVLEAEITDLSEATIGEVLQTVANLTGRSVSISPTIMQQQANLWEALLGTFVLSKEDEGGSEAVTLKWLLCRVEQLLKARATVSAESVRFEADELIED